MRILVVDDDEAQLSSLRDLLPRKCAGITCLCVDNLQAAREMLEREAVDAAILDLRIPPDAQVTDESDSHGYALVERVRTELPGTPVILLTGYGSMEVMHRTYDRYMARGRPYGGAEFQLFQLVTKDNLVDCLNAVALWDQD